MFRKESHVGSMQESSIVGEFVNLQYDGMGGYDSFVLKRDVVAIPVTNVYGRVTSKIEISQLGRSYSGVDKMVNASHLQVKIVKPIGYNESLVDTYIMDSENTDLWVHASYKANGQGEDRFGRVRTVDGHVGKLAAQRNILMKALAASEFQSDQWYRILKVVQLIDKSAKTVLGRQFWI